MKQFKIAFFITVSLIGLSSCSKSSGAAGSSSGSNDPCDLIGSTKGQANGGFTASAGLFTVSPISVAAISGIQPLGNVISPGHTYPSDHIYFNMTTHTAGANQVYAVAAGTVVNISTSRNDGVNFKVTVSVDSSFQYYVDHITPLGGLAVGDSVAAGQVLGSNSGTSSAVDLGVYNFNNASYPGILNSCIQEAERFTDKPLSFYTGALATSLYSKVSTTNADKDGKIGFDIAGKLSGNWVMSGQNPMASQDAQLLMGYDTKTVSTMQISSGGNVIPVGDYGVMVGDTDFGSISVGSGITTYRITHYGNNSQIGSLLVQMTDASTIKIEYFAGVMSGASFDGNAYTYTR